MKDYYVILKVSRDATAEEIRKAHRRQVLRYHPDRSSEPDPDKFREVQEAYETLRHAGRREDYDHRLGAHEQRDRSAARPLHGGPLPLWEDFGRVMPGLEEILDHVRRDVFGPLRKVAPLRDLNVEFVLEPEEAARGVRVPLEVPVCRSCPWCGGGGGAFPFACLHCGGKGWMWGKRTVTVDVPPGVGHGRVFRVPLQRLGIQHLRLSIHIRVGRP